MSDIQEISYSHFGEDKIVSFMFGQEKIDGFYIDVGCYHPALFSNTYMFYLRGWRGILIDANPYMISKCREIRPEDMAINVAIGNSEGFAKFYKFNDWGSSNTLDEDFKNHISETQNANVTEILEVPLTSLSQIFEENVKDKIIDFLNIDIENFDLLALEGNNWTKFRPTVIAVEDLSFDLSNQKRSKVHKFLLAQDYQLESRAVFTSIYVARKKRHKMNSHWLSPTEPLHKTKPSKKRVINQ